MVEARKSAKTAIEASLKVGRARHKVGMLLKQELLDLEVQEASASEQLFQARHSLNLIHQIFNNLLGIPQGEVEIRTYPVTHQEIPTVLQYGERPELAALYKNLAAVRAQLQMAKAKHILTIDSFASYQHDYGFINNGSGKSWLAGATLHYSLYDGQVINAEIAEQEARLAELDALKHKTVGMQQF